MCFTQRLYRKDRLPRAKICYRHLAKFGIVRVICLYNALLGPVCNKLTESCFPCCGVLGFCRFDSKYKILWGETRAHRVPIHEEEKLFKTSIYIIIPIFPPPIISDWRKLGWRGETIEKESTKSGTGNFGRRKGANFNDARQVPRGGEPPPISFLTWTLSQENNVSQ